MRHLLTPSKICTPEYIYTRVFLAHANWTLSLTVNPEYTFISVTNTKYVNMYYVKQSYFFMDKSDTSSSMNLCLCLVAQGILLRSQKSERARKILYIDLPYKLRSERSSANFCAVCALCAFSYFR